MLQRTLPLLATLLCLLAFTACKPKRTASDIPRRNTVPASEVSGVTITFTGMGEKDGARAAFFAIDNKSDVLITGVKGKLVYTDGNGDPLPGEEMSNIYRFPALAKPQSADAFEFSNPPADAVAAEYTPQYFEIGQEE